MLKQQKQHMKDSKQELGESDMGDLCQSKDSDAMASLFKGKDSAKQVKKHVKSKAELETDKLVAQQKQMLKHQKKAIADRKDAENDLGESKDSDAMANLFKDKKSK